MKALDMERAYICVFIYIYIYIYIYTYIYMYVYSGEFPPDKQIAKTSISTKKKILRHWVYAHTNRFSPRHRKQNCHNQNPFSEGKTALHPTGWRRCIGCLELQVSFCKKTTNYRALLWEMTYKDEASYGCSPSCLKSHIFNTRSHVIQIKIQRVNPSKSKIYVHIYEYI